jgi:hypothetical protein
MKVCELAICVGTIENQLSLFYCCCACADGKGGVDSVLIESVIGTDSGELEIDVQNRIVCSMPVDFNMRKATWTNMAWLWFSSHGRLSHFSFHPSDSHLNNYFSSCPLPLVFHWSPKQQSQHLSLHLPEANKNTR